MPATQTEADLADPTANSVACPQLLTPPPESDEDVRIVEVAEELQDSVEHGEMDCAADDNTAHGMASLQERSMYTNHELVMPPASAGLRTELEGDWSNGTQHMSAHGKDSIPSTSQSDTSHRAPSANDVSQTEVSNRLTRGNETAKPPNPDCGQTTSENVAQVMQVLVSESSIGERQLHNQPSRHSSSLQDGPFSPPSAEKASDVLSDPPYPSTPSWDFTHSRLSPQYPSSLLRPGSKFSGTQQSDRQIYNVDVDILTVDIDQAQLTGYLRICGLTEDHPTLTTFFTGEIIGGPNQRYSFRTKHPSWGATDKTDLIHWARFPSWKVLSREAKRDIDFEFPVPSAGLGRGSNDPNRDAWWQQENVYMRWKEHFLVPDHRVKSIAGASFEGFYYATFNQVEGTISGIYFHAKSERYQQLELKHVFNKGICPSMEFR